MVLIPADAGIRMRMETDAALQPIAPAREIPGDAADLRPGQAFTARIQEVLPENTYKALVAGQSLTLALPEGAKAGDTLELVVIDRTPRLIVAQHANQGGEAGASFEAATLSRAAQLIGALLTRDGEPPPPALLARGEPLVAQPGAGTALAAELAPQLARAVSQSGLFYEAHQAQWALGQRPLGELLAEPQAAHSPSLAKSPGAEATTMPREAPAAPRSETASPLVLLRNLFGGEEARASGTPSAQEAATAPLAVPEALRPLVQQQLDAVATQRLAWHGEVWPEQTMQWQIEPDQQGATAGGDDAAHGWVSTLHLVTPRLGEIDARLTLGREGVSIALRTPVGASAADLLDAAPLLRDALAAAGVRLQGFQVKHDLPA